MSEGSRLRLLAAIALLVGASAVLVVGVGAPGAERVPLALIALVSLFLLFWLWYCERNARGVEGRLFGELARLVRPADASPTDFSAQVVVTAAARLFEAAEVELLLMTADGPMLHRGDTTGVRRRRVEPAALDAPWVLRALGRGRVSGWKEQDYPGCSTVLGPADAPFAVLAARRPVGAASFRRRDLRLAGLLAQQAESWLSGEKADQQPTLTSAGDDDCGSDPGQGHAAATPALGVLRDSASRLAELAGLGVPAGVSDIVDELYALERAVASLLGEIALGAEAGRARWAGPHKPADGSDDVADWTTTGVLGDDELATQLLAAEPGL